MPKFLSLTLSRFKRSETGAVAVEFVLIAPILITLLFGTIVMGYYIGVTHSVHQLAAGAARASVVGLDQTERESLANEYLSEAGTRYPLLVNDAVSSTIVFDGVSPAGITVNISYSTNESMLQIANGFLDLGIETIEKSAYLGY